MGSGGASGRPGWAGLAAVCGRLRCPHCGGRLTAGDRTLRCPAGHSYDIARHGHVTLLGPAGRPPAGDSEAMVAARAAFLGAGHYAPIAGGLGAAAVRAAGGHPPGGGCVAELGAGTGYYLAGVVGRLAGWQGVALDASRAALRRAVRADPAIAGVVCDAWSRLPVGDGQVDLVLSVFAPRNAAEIARILTDRGSLVVVTPTAGHLREIVDSLGLIGVDADKPARLAAKLSGHLEQVAAEPIDFELTLDHAAVRALAGMGPSAHHIEPAVLDDRIAGLPPTVRATAGVVVQTFRAPGR